MTLIAAFRHRDGLILGSDSQETRGELGRRLARPTQKVYVPCRGFLLAWAGPQNVAQGFALRLARTRISPSADRLDIEGRLKTILADLRKDESIKERSDVIELFLAWWSRPENKPLALRLFSGGATEWVDSWAFAGAKIGVENASFAMGALRYLDLGALEPRPRQGRGAQGASRRDRHRGRGHRRSGSDGHGPEKRCPARGGG